MTLPFLPNEAGATYSDQAEPDTVDFEILLLGYQGTGVVSGCAITEDPVTPDMTVDVASGIVKLAHSHIVVAAQAGNAITAADGTNPRIDLISINSSGTVVVTAGTAAAQPVAPAIPASSVPLAFVYVPTSDTTIANNQINDKRITLGLEQQWFNVKDYGAVGDGTTDDTTAVQAAVDAMSNGDHLHFPDAGNYLLASPVDFLGTLRGIKITGSGGIDANTGAYVGSAILVSGTHGFRFNNAGTLQHEGPLIENLTFVDVSTGSNAVLLTIEDMNYWMVRFCNFRCEDVAPTAGGGTGINVIQNSGQDNAWAKVDQCRFIGLDIGIDFDGSTGILVLGGSFVMDTGDVGIYMDDRTQNNRVVGTKFDGGVGIHIDGGIFNKAIGCYFEATTTGIDIDDPNAGNFRGNQNSILDCHFFGSSNNPAISIAAGLIGTQVIAPTFSTVTVGIDNFDEDSLIIGTQDEVKVSRLGRNFADATRPAATSVAAGSFFYNTDDNAPNWSDGTNWRDSAGSVT